VRALIEQCQSEKAQIDDRAIGLPAYIARDIGQSMRNKMPDQSIEHAKHQSDVQIEGYRAEHSMNGYLGTG
jgi:hypothetical protein